ncbi:trafficking protein particle complex subunit 2 [Pseudovirgaria hyperparasitica]|uniref:Trafficking protein particle complex subunit 2 n=1 Tax=Pseudovirgaria hyperparasitica TaxID=470096 RepID=A0A6A6WCJ4_9PEZI|nr:trafficking protein particle complex subunit 2 [Pseudovirgaria hyperparasitica]KAF2758831.1 trafficking protein particle complex subunit 2 [Pseudovirgaria hyperparasitica]
MSYYFVIIGTKDNPLFEHEFGTYRQGGDGISRFREDTRHMNQFVAHASLDILEEVQWAGGQMYLKTIDRYPPTGSTISAFITAANAKFLLLHQPNNISTTSNPSSLTANRNAPTSTTPAATDEAIKNFFNDVYDSWVKTIMNPFWRVDTPVRSPVFRSRVAASAKKYL